MLFSIAFCTGSSKNMKPYKHKALLFIYFLNTELTVGTCVLLSVILFFMILCASGTLVCVCVCVHTLTRGGAS